MQKADPSIMKSYPRTLVYYFASGADVKFHEDATNVRWLALQRMGCACLSLALHSAMPSIWLHFVTELRKYSQPKLLMFLHITREILLMKAFHDFIESAALFVWGDGLMITPTLSNQIYSSRSLTEVITL
jgi:hypothetical protein